MSDTGSPPSLSVIVPSYNEAGSIVVLIERILEHSPPAVEVLLVDDDSPDGTAEIARAAFRDDARVRVIVRTEDRGFARSIRTGLEAATGRHVLLMDSDFAHDPQRIPALHGITAYADIVSGSRFAPGGNMQDRTRYLLSLLYNIGLRIVLRTQVQDNLCGFLAMERRKLLALPLDEIFFGFGDYFFRLIYLAQRRGYTIIEVPIVVGVRPSGESKNRLVQTFFQYTKELIRFRWKTLRRRDRSPGRTPA